MVDRRNGNRLTTAVQQLRDRYPDVDPAAVVRAVIDAQGGLTTFGFRDEEQSASLIAEIALRDPRLRVAAPSPNVTP